MSISSNASCFYHLLLVLTKFDCYPFLSLFHVLEHQQLHLLHDSAWDSYPLLHGIQWKLGFPLLHFLPDFGFQKKWYLGEHGNALLLELIAYLNLLKAYLVHLGHLPQLVSWLCQEPDRMISSLISWFNVENWFSDGLKLRQYTKVAPVPIFSIGLLGKVCL